jgi:hypothetical protein
MIPRPAPAETKRALSGHSAKASSAAPHLRNDPGNLDDLNVIGPDGKIMGRILKPYGREGWQWNLFAVVPRPLRNTGMAPSCEEALAAFRETSGRRLAPTQPR